MKHKLIFGAILIFSFNLKAFTRLCSLNAAKLLDPTNQNQKTVSCDTTIDHPLEITITNQIGSGGFGKVFDGRAVYFDNNVERNVAVAIKQIRINAPVVEGYDSVSDTISSINDVNNEFATLKYLSTIPDLVPFILKPYALFIDGPFAYIVMEYGGVTLEKYLIDNKENYASVFVRISRQLQQVLNALKNAGIAHLDIHPKNILVNDQNKVKLIDFGLSKKIGDPVLNVGNSLYRDPNIFIIKKAYAGYDEYSVAVIIDEMLQGHSLLGTLLNTKELRNTAFKPGDELYNKLLENYKRRLSMCLQDQECIENQYTLLQSLDPDFKKRGTLNKYIDSLK